VPPEAGLAAASKRIEATYETPAQYHNAMEPNAVVAAWDGDKLSLDTPSQGLALAQGRVAGLFGIPPEKIHIRSPFLGGGFGSKGLISGPQILGIMAARLVGRPVKLVLRREQMYGPVGHRPPTRQTLRLGSDRDGALTAIDHHTKTTSSTFDDFFEPAADAYRQVLQLEPQHKTCHYNLAVCLEKTGRYKEALKYAPQDPNTQALSSEIEQARIRRDIVLGNYPSYKSVGAGILTSLKLVITTDKDIQKQVAAFAYDYDLAHLTKAIEESTVMQDDVAGITQRITAYRALVQAGVPRAQAPIETETPNLLPIP